MVSTCLPDMPPGYLSPEQSRYNAPMPRRWIIRSLFMLPILLCMAGWGWAATHDWTGWYEHMDSRRIILIQSFSNWKVFNLQVKYIYGEYSVFSSGMGRSLDADTFFGFAIQHYFYMASETYGVTIPCWFPTVFSSLVFLFVWRKSRPKVNPKTAFPVETVMHD